MDRTRLGVNTRERDPMISGHLPANQRDRAQAHGVGSRVDMPGNLKPIFRAVLAVVVGHRRTTFRLRDVRYSRSLRRNVVRLAFCIPFLCASAPRLGAQAVRTPDDEARTLPAGVIRFGFGDDNARIDEFWAPGGILTNQGAALNFDT